MSTHGAKDDRAVPEVWAKLPWSGADPWQEAWGFWMDAWRRTILFWDVLRQRSNQYDEQEAKAVPHVLSVEGERAGHGLGLDHPGARRLARSARSQPRRDPAAASPDGRTRPGWKSTGVPAGSSIRMATRTAEGTERRGTGKYEELLARCKAIGAIPTAVAHPCDDVSLGAVVEAAREGIITPIVVGPPRTSGRWRSNRGSTSRLTRSPTPPIAAPPSRGPRLSAWVIPTDEERMIAEHTLAVWREQQPIPRVA